ncbi:flagellar motor switch protein FliN [Buchnera aphidicola]|uniref:Flagellar motor switch protein FliN n=1 Tax=Buchnera aphidicola str. Ua (Uroleucon ambrosiae) TaxID=1005057 RepID=G2LNW6_BUCUM|nr:flagellar motor switch protein FliN [Buchnera aphidicola]AEO07903.1 flagellar motor switch protein FliN [Buchnera aphidicola str. Ua (Uroleucon ambrosiae)]
MSNTLKHSKNQNITTTSEQKTLETELINQDFSHEKELNDSEKLITSKNLVLNTLVTITIELGKSKIKIKDFLKLSQGNVLVLNKSVQEPLDIFINDYLIASGEIVVLDQKYGIRITNIKSYLNNIDISS